MSIKKVAIYTAVTWALTFVFSSLLIVVAAVALEKASIATAETAVFLLVLVQLLAAGVGIFLVFRKTRIFSGMKRLTWMLFFSMAQLGFWALFAVILLLVLNR